MSTSLFLFFYTSAVPREFFFKILFILRELVSGARGGVRRARERISSRLHAEHGARSGAQSHDPEIMT